MADRTALCEDLNGHVEPRGDLRAVGRARHGQERANGQLDLDERRVDVPSRVLHHRPQRHKLSDVAFRCRKQVADDQSVSHANEVVHDFCFKSLDNRGGTEHRATAERYAIERDLAQAVRVGCLQLHAHAVAHTHRLDRCGWIGQDERG